MIKKSQESFDLSFCLADADKRAELLTDPQCPVEFLTQYTDIALQLIQEDRNDAKALNYLNSLIENLVLPEYLISLILENEAILPISLISLARVHPNSHLERKEIKTDLLSKFEGTLKHNSLFKNKLFPDFIQEHGFIAGGSISRILNGQPQADIDIFFKDRLVVRNLLDWILPLFHSGEKGEVVKFKISDTAHGLQLEPDVAVKKPHWVFKGELRLVHSSSYTEKIPMILTQNAITLFEGALQLIFKSIGPPKDVIGDFDFYHCMNYYDFKADVLHLEPLSVYSNKQAKLMFNPKAISPVGALFRLNKLVSNKQDQYGSNVWSIPKVELVKIVIAVNQAKIESFDEFFLAVGGFYADEELIEHIIKTSSQFSGEPFSKEKMFDILLTSLV